jgi:2'-5' RNA ligase
VSDAPVRAFFAIDLDAAARASALGVLRVLREAPGGGAVRWVRPEGLHVTLHFLGNIERAQATPLARAVSEEVREIARFDLALGAARLFPSVRRPRVVALDVKPAERVAELAAAVERGVTREGFEPEGRSFRAHLTLGRIRQGGGPDPSGVAAAGSSPVEEVVLFRSELSRSGARYTPLERVGLGHP